MYSKYKKVKNFLRPSKKGASLWGKNGIRPDSTKQGQLGDCWVLAVGAALAEHPERVKKLFANKEYSKVGVFMLKLFDKG